MPGKADFFFMNIPNRPKVAKFKAFERNHPKSAKSPKSAWLEWTTKNE